MEVSELKRQNTQYQMIAKRYKQLVADLTVKVNSLIHGHTQADHAS